MLKRGISFIFDPPYYPLNPTSFTSYTKDNFGPEEHKELAAVFKELTDRGCMVAYSNSSTEEGPEII